MVLKDAEVPNHVDGIDKTQTMIVPKQV